MMSSNAGLYASGSRCSSRGAVLLRLEFCGRQRRLRAPSRPSPIGVQSTTSAACEGLPGDRVMLRPIPLGHRQRVILLAHAAVQRKRCFPYDESDDRPRDPIKCTEAINHPIEARKPEVNVTVRRTMKSVPRSRIGWRSYLPRRDHP
jgi:hypothetical protein